ncbi:MAG: hypothetical protein HY255_06635 [Betaproteobacteria bacterium]|nr:hypothetical protein [Betaproteobacteria bacterium]
MFSANTPTSVANRPIALSISSDQSASYNVFSAAGNPSDAVDVTVTIGSGIKVSEMRALSFAPGSRVFIVNNGFILGAGGTGGYGGSIYGTDIFAGFQGNNGTNAGNGTDALQSNCRLILTNASGAIYAGGGGGAGGTAGGVQGSYPYPGPPTSRACGGSGGGGGQGYPGGAGGFGGAGYGDGTTVANGGNGNSGSFAGRGSLGSGVTSGGGSGGIAGNGGTWGNGGDSPLLSPSPDSGSGCGGGMAGNQGRAIFSNGAGVTWISGSGNVVGSVS